MSEEIINRVANNSALIVVDLEDYYPKGERIVFDIKPWLIEELVLHEKQFRAEALAHNWAQYENAYVALICSSDAIIPAWAFMLISTYLESYAKKIVIGSKKDLETLLYNEIINAMDVSSYEGKALIIKGCAKMPVPENAYVFLLQRLKPIARSIMYGEACSAVPLYKKSKT